MLRSVYTSESLLRCYLTAAHPLASLAPANRYLAVPRHDILLAGDVARCETQQQPSFRPYHQSQTEDRRDDARRVRGSKSRDYRCPTQGLGARACSYARSPGLRTQRDAGRGDDAIAPSTFREAAQRRPLIYSPRCTHRVLLAEPFEPAYTESVKYYLITSSLALEAD